MNNIELNEQYFKEENPKRTLESHLEKGENVLWRGSPNKLAYVLSQTMLLAPFAIFWAGIDVFAIITFLSTSLKALMFIVPFFAFHMMPVWIWIKSIVSSISRAKSTVFVITNERIIEFDKNAAIIKNAINITDLTDVSISRGLSDRILKVGDILIKSESKHFYISDLPNYKFIYNKVYDIFSHKDDLAKRQTQFKEFYQHKVVCTYCGTHFDSESLKCPSCGGTRKE